MVVIRPALNLIRNRSLASSDIDIATEDRLLPRQIDRKIAGITLLAREPS